MNEGGTLARQRLERVVTELTGSSQTRAKSALKLLQREGWPGRAVLVPKGPKTRKRGRAVYTRRTTSTFIGLSVVNTGETSWVITSTPLSRSVVDDAYDGAQPSSHRRSDALFTSHCPKKRAIPDAIPQNTPAARKVQGKDGPNIRNEAFFRKRTQARVESKWRELLNSYG